MHIFKRCCQMMVFFWYLITILKIETIGSSIIMCPKPGGELAFTSGPMFVSNLTKTAAVTASIRVGFLGV